MKLLYALGGGHGHVRRAAGVARALESAGERVTLFVPSRHASSLTSAGHSVWAVERTSIPLRLRAALEQAARTLSVRHLIVDAFPEGLYGELVAPLPFARRSVLLRLRRDAHELTATAALYDDVIDVEPGLGWAPSSLRARALGPVVTLAEELALAARPDVVLAAGDDEALLGLFSRLAPRLERRGARVCIATGARAAHSATARKAAGRDVRSTALSPTSLGATVMVGAAGYHLSYECAGRGVHHLALPRPRRFDDQRRRALAIAEVPSGPLALERRVLSLLESSTPRTPLALASYDDIAAVLSAPAARDDPQRTSADADAARANRVV